MNKQPPQPSTINYQLSKKPIVFVVGPTASGKSSLAMQLARKLDGEIICADSQTIRRGLDIGTAKPSKAEQAEIPHHLLDIIEPYAPFSVSEFKNLAILAIDEIKSRNKMPIVVGGTGLYIDSLFFDFKVDDQKTDEKLKNDLEKLSVVELQKIIIDRSYPMPTNLNNPRHLIGVILRGGIVHEDKQPIDGAKIYGLLPEDEVLKSRINHRVDKMFESGVVEETRKVMEKYGRPTKKLDTIGYSIIIEYIDGRIDLEEAKELFKSTHWQYARRQKSWFKRNPFITWFSKDNDAVDKIINEVNHN